MPVNATLTLGHIVIDGHNHLLPVEARGGVDVNGNIAMLTGSVITRNRLLSIGGGGIALTATTGVFTMRGGTISNNISTGSNGGGGVDVRLGTFNMHGGTISGNTATTSQGAGVHLGHALLG